MPKSISINTDGRLLEFTPAIADISGLQTALDGKAGSSHVHGNITNAGAIGSTSGLPIITTALGVLTAGAFGTIAGSFCQGNDGRLSDARTPTAHNQAWSTITATPTTISGYGLTDAASTGANTLTGAQLIRAAAGQDAIEILGRAGGTSSFKATITPLALSASRTWSLPDRSDTFAGLGAQTFTGTQTLPAALVGATATHPGAPASGYISLGATVGRKIDLYQGSETHVGIGVGLGGGPYELSLYGPAGPANMGTIRFGFISEGNPGTWSEVGRFNASGAFVLGTDPGGSELLRVGGGAKVGGSLTAQRLIANDGFIGLVGDISASRGDGTGCIFFSGAGTRYIYSDGNVFDFSGAPINASSYRVLNTKVLGGQASAIADVSTADATDLASAVALANANKAKINTILAMLRTHGLIAT
jgi:hypothetical protein